MSCTQESSLNAATGTPTVPVGQIVEVFWLKAIVSGLQKSNSLRTILEGPNLNGLRALLKQAFASRVLLFSCQLSKASGGWLG